MITFLNPPVRTEFLGIGPIASPRNTAAKMRGIIRESAHNEYVRKWAERITDRVRDRDEQNEINNIFHFLQAKTRYVRDPRGMEYIQTPPYVLQQIELGLTPGLDCDDYTVTGLSLAMALGYPTVIRVTGYRPDGRYTHVYGMVNIHGQWVAFDPVRKDKDLGWEAPGILRRMDLPV